MKKVIIAGSRNFNNYALLKSELDKLFNEPFIIVSGGAKGADTLGERFADEFNIKKNIILPNWQKYGKSAGFKRNIEIINSKIYNKIKNIFGIITNDKTIITEYGNDTNTNISINQKDLSLKDLNKNFDQVLEQLSPNMKRRTIPTCNNNTSSPKEKYSNVTR